MSSSPTQRAIKVPLSEAAGLALCSGQWLLENADDPAKRKRNELDVKICGEDGFSAIVADLRGARHSVDIICYGFDPAMEVERSGPEWPRGTTFGDLLAERAASGIRIRVLCGYGPMGAKMPGAGEAVSRVARRPRETLGQGRMHRSAKQILAQPAMTPQLARHEFNVSWYESAFAGDISNLSFRVRRLTGQAVDAGLAADPNAPWRGAVETLGLETTATHHQKTILVDYDLDDGSHAVGYVMGLNAVTDYWDTPAHRFDEPLRGAAWEGDGGEPGLMPYQDYACRIRGEALIDVDKNFCDAWNRTRPTEKGGEGPAAVHRRQAGVATLLGANVQAQIVRTQPEEQAEQSVRRLYAQAIKFARKYIYVENQYFQYSPWVEQIKSERQSYRASYQRGQGNYGKDNGIAPSIPWLHVFVVTPTPERSIMVPRTHDTVKALGHGESMPHQDQLVEDELKRHREATERYDRQKAAYDHSAQRPGGPVSYPPQPVPALSPLAKDSKALGDKSSIQKQLADLGVRTLVASLWTFDKQYLSTQRDGIRQLTDWTRTSPHDPGGNDTGMARQRIRSQESKLFKARYREIYIHSKLLLIDDGFFTVGSANLNQRSMASDSEINVATDDVGKARDLRQRVWELHTGDAPGKECNPIGNEEKAIEETFANWKKLLLGNFDAMKKGELLKGFLTPFFDGRSTNIRAG